jgi:hypothetical protein
MQYCCVVWKRSPINAWARLAPEEYDLAMKQVKNYNKENDGHYQGAYVEEAASVKHLPIIPNLK